MTCSLKHLIACPECDLLMEKVHLSTKHRASCPRCGYELFVSRTAMKQRSFALAITALVLFFPANFLPIMQLSLLGVKAEDTIWSAVVSLYTSDMKLVALFVFLFSVLIPFLKLIAQAIVLICIFYKKSLNIGRFFYRGYQVFREWGMLEVYLFGIIVSIVKLIDMADVKVGIGMFCFVGLLLSQLWLDVTMSEHQIWDDLDES
ncbi:MAG: paraquat-inducible protein A [Pseudomonas sp.]